MKISKLLKPILIVGLFITRMSAYGEVQTSIPVVRLQYDDTKLNRDSFCDALFLLVDNGDSVFFKAQVRHRGATSAKFKKKSYAVKLYNESGQKVDSSLMGMRSDNYWILDAMAIDPSRMRNRVAMDLWLDFSAKPYYALNEPMMCNGYRGKYVELYVNDAYNGLYSLMERVDRKQLKLKKYKNNVINGQLYKSVNWIGWTNDGVFRISESYDNSSSTWMRYEYAYPDPEEDGPIDWKPLYDDLYFAQTAKDKDFATQAESRFDIPVFIDYFLFTMLLSARDNYGKNLFLSYYNINQSSKMLVTPWDLELSFGRQIDGPTEDPEAKWVWKGLLYQRLEDTFQYYTQMRKRYAYLRSGVFSPEALKKRFSDYFDLFYETGAGEREMQRWSGADKVVLNFDEEEEYIYQWIDQRLVYVDDFLDYSYYQDIENNPADTQRATKIMRNGEMYILQGDKVYTITGLPVH